MEYISLNDNKMIILLIMIYYIWNCLDELLCMIYHIRVFKLLCGGICMKLKFGKLFSVFGVILLSVFIFSPTSTYAAVTPIQLFQPEEGWTRFDDTNAAISYSGTWQVYKDNSSAFWKGGHHYSTSNGASSKFKFTGTKIRLVNNYAPGNSSRIQVTIDGVSEIISEYSSTYKYLTVVYEKTGLSPGTHTIELKNLVSGKELLVDAIDLDEGGYLIGINSPAILSASSGDSQITLSWDKVDNAESYTVYYGTESGKYTNFVTVTSDVYSNYTIPNLTNGVTYYIVATASVNGVESGYSNEVSATPSAVALNPVLAVIINEDTVTVGQEFDATISLKNVDKIYAEDFTINYDTTLFKYLGYEEITGYKVYNESADKSGNIRFIIASQGEEYGIHEDTTILKLKFRAISIGTGDVDALRGRIADTEREFDLDEENCLLDSVIVEAVTVDDVNRSGEYTLVDLAIDGYYFGKAVADTDTARHSADQVIDGYVNDEDLVYIVNQMLNNANYSRNL